MRVGVKIDLTPARRGRRVPNDKECDRRTVPLTYTVELSKTGYIMRTRGDQYVRQLDPFNIEARYPDYKEKIEETLTDEKCGRILKETEDFLCWIKNELGR